MSTGFEEALERLKEKYKDDIDNYVKLRLNIPVPEDFTVENNLRETLNELIYLSEEIGDKLHQELKEEFGLPRFPAGESHWIHKEVATNLSITDEGEICFQVCYANYIYYFTEEEKQYQRTKREFVCWGVTSSTSSYDEVNTSTKYHPDGNWQQGYMYDRVYLLKDNFQILSRLEGMRDNELFGENKWTSSSLEKKLANLVGTPFQLGPVMLQYCEKPRVSNHKAFAFMIDFVRKMEQTKHLPANERERKLNEVINRYRERGKLGETGAKYQDKQEENQRVMVLNYHRILNFNQRHVLMLFAQTTERLGYLEELDTTPEFYWQSILVEYDQTWNNIPLPFIVVNEECSTQLTYWKYI